MESNSVNDKATKRYAIAAVIIIVMNEIAPEIAIAVLYGANSFAIFPPIDNWRLVMHLAGVAFLIVVAIVYDLSRGKHARKQPAPHQEEHAIAAVIIAVVTTYAIGVTYLMGINVPDISGTPHFERIEIKSASVTKSTNAYFVTVNFANTGNLRTDVDSLLLNGVPYDDSGWTGTLRPVVFGDLTPKTVIDVGVPYSGIIIFGDDCKDPRGNKLLAGGDDHYYLNLTIHTTGDKDYTTSVMLPQSSIPETLPFPALMLATTIVAVIAFTALFIIVRRRTRTSPIKGPVTSV
jgi:hypothetical protein